MKKRRKFTERIMACALAALMVVGVVPLDFAGFGAKEVKAAGTEYVLDMTNITDHTEKATAPWNATIVLVKVVQERIVTVSFIPEARSVVAWIRF